MGEEYVASTYMAPGKRGIMIWRHNAHEIQVYVGGQTDSERLQKALGGGIPEQKEALPEMMQGAGLQTDEVLDSLKGSDNFYCERLGLVKMDSWSQGRMVLVGDAAYCPTATIGMGTTSGIVGAYILAIEIGKHCGSPRKLGHEAPLTMVSSLRSKLMKTSSVLL